MLRTSAYLLLVVKVFVIAREPDIQPLPRGVPYNRGPLYKKSSEFVCFDGSKSIKYDHVNDDYCDCPDGSDEPGTSACPNGKFHCANKGHTPADIPSSRVNDKICDCCDGSDEYSGSVECPNICDELGNSAREQKRKQMEIERKGYAARKILAAEGQKLREEKLQVVIPLKEEKAQLLLKKEELLQMKNLAVEKEATLKDKHREAWLEKNKMKKMVDSKTLFQEIDVDGNQRITLDEIKNLGYLDDNHDGTVSEEEAKAYIAVDSADADVFFNEMYEKIKRMKHEHEKNRKEQELKDTHNGLAPDEDQEKVENDEGDGNRLESDEDSMPPYDEETLKAIEEADTERKRSNCMDVSKNSCIFSSREAESFAEQDFGTDYAWATLKGKCFERTEKQYTYKFCPFERAMQIEKGGVGETSLGSFLLLTNIDSFAYLTLCTRISLHCRNWREWSGELLGKYSKQSYRDGQACWNGPQRSTEVSYYPFLLSALLFVLRSLILAPIEVDIQCGEDSELSEASEPAKCEYRFVFRTPAACNDPDQEEATHVEL
uniref:Glucosidase 2 subunit beta n=1 Tax=Angiostrongylus cantonensis TaxID=6313 RepID=A0A0K0DCN2_ANGCA